jgi:hypothetical protein
MRRYEKSPPRMAALTWAIRKANEKPKNYVAFKDRPQMSDRMVIHHPKSKRPITLPKIDWGK